MEKLSGLARKEAEPLLGRRELPGQQLDGHPGHRNGEPDEAEDQGEDIYNSAEDFGDAIGMLLRLRSSEPEPTGA